MESLPPSAFGRLCFPDQSTAGDCSRTVPVPFPTYFFSSFLLALNAQSYAQTAFRTLKGNSLNLRKNFQDTWPKSPYRIVTLSPSPISGYFGHTLLIVPSCPQKEKSPVPTTRVPIRGLGYVRVSLKGSPCFLASHWCPRAGPFPSPSVS